MREEPTYTLKEIGEMFEGMLREYEKNKPSFFSKERVSKLKAPTYEDIAAPLDIEYPPKLRVLELFAGIGACSKALTNLGIPHTIVDAVEIDKHAVKSFNAVHGTNFEPQDITKWDKDIECDLIMHGSPCQDFSVAGLGKGGDEGSGTRSSLMYETLRIVEKLKPKYVIWENVKNLLSQKHRHNFDAYIEAMERLGYKSVYQVLNARDYGVPQNRERIFTVSIRGENNFLFPAPVKLEHRLRDVLEADVAEKYYINEEQAQKIKMNKNIDVAKTVRTGGRGSVDRHSWDMVAEPTDNINMVGLLDIKGNEQVRRVYDPNHISPTLNTMQGGNRQPKVIIDDYNCRVRADQSTIGTLTTNCGGAASRVGWKIAEVEQEEPIDYRIRRLTPLECWRLMGFDDADFAKAKEVCSDSQLYKQAGNSIVVKVLEAIFKNLFKEVNNG